MVDLVGKLWYGKTDWDRKKRGLGPLDETVVEPYHASPFDELVWEAQKKRKMEQKENADDRHTGRPNQAP